MWTARTVFTNYWPLARRAVELLVYICAAALLSFLVLQLHELNRLQGEREVMALLVLDTLRDLKAQGETRDQRLSDLEMVVWGDIRPKVEAQASTTPQAPPRVVVPAWQNREQELMDRLRALEQWRLRHMSLEH